MRAPITSAPTNPTSGKRVKEHGAQQHMQRSKQLLRGQRWHIESHLSRRSTISPSYRRPAAAVPLSFTLPAGCREVPPDTSPYGQRAADLARARTLRVDDTE